MKAVTLVTLADLMRGVVTLVKMVDLKLGNRIWGLYKSLTLVTLIFKAILSKKL